MREFNSGPIIPLQSARHLLAACNDILWTHINDRNFTPNDDELEFLASMMKLNEQHKAMTTALYRRAYGKYEELPDV